MCKGCACVFAHVYVCTCVCTCTHVCAHVCAPAWTWIAVACPVPWCRHVFCTVLCWSLWCRLPLWAAYCLLHTKKWASFQMWSMTCEAMQVKRITHASAYCDTNNQAIVILSDQTCLAHMPVALVPLLTWLGDWWIYISFVIPAQQCHNQLTPVSCVWSPFHCHPPQNVHTCGSARARACPCARASANLGLQKLM